MNEESLKTEAAEFASNNPATRLARRSLLMLKLISISSTFIVGVALAFGQISAPGDSLPQTSKPSQGTTLSDGAAQSIGQLEQLAQSTSADLRRVRVDKWKTDDRDKDQARSNAESLQRNLTGAVPTLVQQVRANPTSVAANLKLYRNLNAVYDVLSSFTESAGAFGSKEDYNALARDTANLDNIRRNLADQLEQMASLQDAQVARLTAQLKAQPATAASSTTPKKVVVDDGTPAKTTSSTKKKTVPKPPSPQ